MLILDKIEDLWTNKKYQKTQVDAEGLKVTPEVRKITECRSRSLQSAGTSVLDNENNKSAYERRKTANTTSYATRRKRKDASE